MSTANGLPGHVIWLSLAALASLAGSGAILKMVGAVTVQEAGLPSPGVSSLGVYFLVILLGVAGLVLAAMAVKELIDFRRQLRLR